MSTQVCTENHSEMRSDGRAPDPLHLPSPHYSLTSLSSPCPPSFTPWCNSTDCLVPLRCCTWLSGLFLVHTDLFPLQPVHPPCSPRFHTFLTGHPVTSPTLCGGARLSAIPSGNGTSSLTKSTSASKPGLTPSLLHYMVYVLCSLERAHSSFSPSSSWEAASHAPCDLVCR